MPVCRRSNPVALVAATGVLAAFLSSCGGGSSPSTPTPTPTPTAQPTPPPVTGGDPFHHSSCPLGKGDENAACAKGRSAALLNEIESAMDRLVLDKPQLFDLTNEYDAGTKAYKVVDREGYLNGLVSTLREAGLCAERDPDDALQQTIRAKSAADSSESFDVLLSSGHMRRGTGMYRSTCTPSSFPVDRSADAPPIGSGCGRPYPPPITRFNCKVHIKSPQYYTLDSTPIVGPDGPYCRSIGYDDGRTLCPIRPEGAPDRVACENWRVGKARDTGRPGPTWTKADGGLCTGPESGCQNHPDNQYSLFTFESGTYVVTAENGASCKVSH
ncbi:MAG TPA: hypothetical protein VGB87_11150 [Vicinamibacteria bacterium]